MKNLYHVIPFLCLLAMPFIGNSQALSFDGVDDYVNIPTFTNNSTEHTLEAWIRSTGGTGHRSIFSWINGVVGGSEEVQLNINPSGNIRYGQFDYLNSNFDEVNGTVFVDDGNWHHVAVTASATTISLYIDGVLDAQGVVDPTNASYANAQFLELGSLLDNGGVRLQYFAGEMDELRIWTVARTCEEIRFYMDCELTGSEAGLEAYYNCDQGIPDGNNLTETTIFDQVGIHNGTLNNFTLSGNTSNWVTATNGVFGICGNLPVQDEILVEGNFVNIANGSTTTSTGNETDWGTQTLGTSITHTFSITNNGFEEINLTSNPIIQLSGGTGFTVSQQPSSAILSTVSSTLINPPSTVFFDITYTPSSIGTETATVSFNTDDCDETLFTFDITGEGVAATPGGALNFDGMDDYVEIPFLGTATTEHSFEAWIKSDGGTGHRSIITWQGGGIGTNEEIQLNINPSGTLRYGQYDYGNSIFDEVNGTINVDNGGWHHVAVTVNSTTMSLYVNGYLDAQAPVNPANAVISSVNDLYLGVLLDNNGIFEQYFNGEIDEVRIWTTERTCEELRYYRNCELIGNEAGLLTYYQFNQGIADSNNATETSLLGGTPSFFDGILQNFALDGTTSNWVEGTNDISGSCSGAPIGNELEIDGNGIVILDGDTNPETADGTDWGTQLIGTSVDHTFTLSNVGFEDISIITFPQPFQITGSSAFTISNQPIGNIYPPTASASFTVTFTPTGTGVETATIFFESNDCDEQTYSFDIKGEGISSAAASASSNSPICEGSDINLSENGGVAISWSWEGTNGFTSSDQNPIITNASNLESGDYTVTITDSNGQTATSSVTVSVNAIPTSSTVNDSPVCEGGDVNLIENGGDAAAWSWEGANGFTSADQNPILNAISLANSGNYTVTITDVNGCTSSSTTTIVVNTLPMITLGSNSPVCEGNDIDLTESGGDADTWSWAGANGFTSVDQNPQITGASLADDGNYTVTITDTNGCTSSSMKTIIVNTLPMAVISSNSPVCEGSDINLMESGGDADTWSWAGANGFTSTEQNPQIAGASLADDGNYSVTITNVDGCTSSSTTTVIVNTAPVVTLGNNSPICEGNDISLTESGGDADTWSWVGANGFTSVDQNPQITGASLADDGNYTVTITNGDGCTSSSTTTVVVNPLPIITLGSNSPICEGDDVNLAESGGDADTWSWEGANGFMSADQNPQVTAATLAATGDYTVTITDENGCISSSSTSVIVNTLPVAMAGTNSPICENNSMDLTESGGDAIAWSWEGANGFLSTDQNPILASVPLANDGNYTVTVTDANNCTSTDEVTVIIEPLPVIVLGSNSPLCLGDDLLLTESGGDAIDWTWAGVGNFGDTEQNPSILSTDLLNAGDYTVVVTGTNGCTTSQTTTVIINDLPAVNITSNSPVCEGDDINLGEDAGDGTVWSWTGSESYVSTAQNPIITTVELNMEGVYTVTVTDVNTCSNTGAADITILPQPLVGIDQQGQACTENSTLLLGENGGEAESWSWTGPNGYTATTQDLDLTGIGIDEGNYQVTGVGINGCTDTVSVDVIVYLGTAFMSNFLTPDTACIGDTLHFVEISETNLVPTSTIWSFGDGNTSTDRDPTHIYQSTGTYLINVEVFDQECGNISLEKNVEILNCRNDYSLNNILELQVFPNPSNGDFYMNISLLEKDDILIQIYNIYGHLIKEEKVKDFTSDTKRFSIDDSGMYIVRIRSGQGQLWEDRKVIIQK